MSAALPTPPFLPVSSPVVVEQRMKRMPRELEAYVSKARRNQAQPFEAAIAALANEVYGMNLKSGQQSPTDLLASAFRGLGRAVNETAMAAFAPASTIDYATADVAINTATWTDITGLSREIVAAIPSRLAITLQLDALCNAPGPDALQVRANVAVSGTATAFYALGYLIQFSIGERVPVVTFDLLDLGPGVIYTVKAQARVAAAGASDYTILGTTGRSAMSLRLEARSLATGS